MEKAGTLVPDLLGLTGEAFDQAIRDEGFGSLGIETLEVALSGPREPPRRRPTGGNHLSRPGVGGPHQRPGEGRSPPNRVFR